MTNIVFIDTETTGLHPDRRAWDIAVILRRPGKEDVESQWFVDAGDLDLGNADPYGLRVGHFYERHPQFRTDVEFDWKMVTYERHPQFRTDVEFDWKMVTDEDEALSAVEVITRGAHLVGAVPNFDADVLGTRMREQGLLPSWHYHLIDVETLAVGWMAGQRATGLGYPALPSLPWDSEALSLALGVQPPGEADRHTALGDARWARDMYDAVMGAS